MPIYEYRCEDCDNINEIYFKSSECPRGVDCRLCGKIAIKIISAPGTVRVGDGKLSGIDDTDEFTFGKLIANKGIPAEHKREWDKRQKRIQCVLEYDKERIARSKEFDFKSQDSRIYRDDRTTKELLDE